MTETQRQKCRTIFEHYGVKGQRRQLVEECAELIKAVSKFERACEGGDFRAARDELLGELADVKIMLMQFEEGFFGREAVSAEVDRKLGRQMRRIRDEKAAQDTKPSETA